MCFFISLFVITSLNSNSEYNQYVNKSYIVMDSLTNNVLEGKNIHLARSVASVSKIMTAIVAIEEGNLDENVEIIKEDLKTYGSSIYLKEGNTLSLLDLVYGLMLRSGNDAAKAIARYVGGSEEGFVYLMNEKALEIGMKNSKFNNPSGLDIEDEGNISTSYDLGLLMSYALKNEVFLRIISTKTYKSEIGVWKNKNKLLTSYKYNIGGKTGFTDKARRTLVTASKKGDTTLVVVTLDCGNDFNFHKFLCEKNFDKYISIKVFNKGNNHIEDYFIQCKKDIYVSLEGEGKNYTLLYKIGGEKISVYLIEEKKESLVGQCRIIN